MRRPLTEHQSRLLAAMTAIGEGAGFEVEQRLSGTALRTIGSIAFKDAASKDIAIKLHVEMDSRAFGGTIVYPGETIDQWRIPHRGDTSFPERRLLITYFEFEDSVAEVLETIRSEVAKMALPRSAAFR